ncbi:adenosylhomocysteinase [Streptomyces sp. P9(2023)]|uniref:adenosylhomocysteinase n=1 Tax=Streptomyces sp. P9(2023) TaxID=3064394 RepID=UPI0028F44014|nr:adenosylhomocysteinase [Streptomyces sp. P9(2023)]MDT9688809.1 adenosylhomocysteinase [Streptomyces sp. P9(2023)]
METFERARLDAYFGRITSRFAPAERPAAFLITHLLPERPAFVRGIAGVTDLRAVLPKPKSVHDEALRQIESEGHPCDRLSRELFADPDRAVRYLDTRAAGRSVVLLDVGGYFAPSIETLCDRLVIGFGKLGSSIARLLHAKGVRVTVYDIDPVRRTQALSQGFTVARDREGGLGEAGLVLCATGALSLRGEDFTRLRNGAYVATVTSSEDELELAGLPHVYERATVGEHVTRYVTTGHYFYLLNGGNAVNFLHGASVGPFIFLVQAEILAASAALARGELDPGMHEISPGDRATIAALWLDYFNR